MHTRRLRLVAWLVAAEAALLAYVTACHAMTVAAHLGWSLGATWAALVLPPTGAALTAASMAVTTDHRRHQ